jgi:hypothetical protein
MPAPKTAKTFTISIVEALTAAKSSKWKKGWRKSDLMATQMDILPDKVKQQMFLDVAEFCGYLAGSKHKSCDKQQRNKKGLFVKGTTVPTLTWGDLAAAWGVSRMTMMRWSKRSCVPTRTSTAVHLSPIDSFKAAAIKLTAKQLFLQHQQALKFGEYESDDGEDDGQFTKENS